MVRGWGNLIRMKSRVVDYRVRIKINAYRLRPPLTGRSAHATGSPALNVASAEKAKFKSFSPSALESASKVSGILQADLSRHHSISKLARKVGLNSRSLQDCFKYLHGKGIFEYGQDLRLEHSKKLLRETDLTLQEIAEACGYQEQSNFSLAFMKKYGVRPGGWRRGV